MKDNYTNSKLLLSLPAFVIVVGIASGVLATILETLTDRGSIYGFFLMMVLKIIFLFPIPCIIAAIAGIWLAVRAYQKENRRVVWLMIWGITEVIVFSLIFVFSILAFSALMSV